MRVWFLAVAALMATGCISSGPKGVESLSEDFTIIEGHLAAKPFLERGGKRLVIYVGDRTVPAEVVNSRWIFIRAAVGFKINNSGSREWR